MTTTIHHGPADDDPTPANAPPPWATSVTTPTPPPSRVIRYFGDYVMMGAIASGGMGVVHRARQVSLNRNVALKMIHPGKLDRPDSLRRFCNEGEAMAALRHDHIVHIYEIGEQDGHHYISMELVEGESLADLIARRGQRHNSELETRKPELDQSPVTSAGTKPGSPSPAVTLARRTGDGSGVRAIGEGERLSDLAFGTLKWQRAAAELLVKVARAVHYAHQRGVLHRDLKPANIMVDEAGEPHLTDFGLAKLMENDTDLTLSQDVIGTPNYMAPEQAAGKNREVTTAADIYSLGAILFAALAGQPPFQGETSVEVLRKVAEERPPHPRSLNPEVDRYLETICLKCLDKKPTRRYASADALADDLERWLSHQPILARPSGTIHHLHKWICRKPALAALAGALAVSVIAGLAAVVWQSREAHLSAIRANTEAERAKGEAERSRYISQVLIKILVDTADLITQEDKSNLLAQAVSVVQNAQRDEALDAAQVFLSFANELQKRGELDKAERLCKESLGLVERHFSNTDHDYGDWMVRLIRLLNVQSKFTEAELLARKCLEMRNRYPHSHGETFQAGIMLGESLLGQGKFAEAEPLLLAGYEGLKQHRQMTDESGHLLFRESIKRLIQLFEATAQPTKATEYEQRLMEFDAPNPVKAQGSHLNN